MKEKKESQGHWSTLVHDAFSFVYDLTQIADIPKKHIKKLREIEDAITEDALSPDGRNPIGLTMKEQTGEVPIR